MAKFTMFSTMEVSKIEAKYKRSFSDLRDLSYIYSQSNLDLPTDHRKWKNESKKVLPLVIRPKEIWKPFHEEPISYCNHYINVMTEDQLKYFASKHNLDPNGECHILKRRLQHFVLRYRRKYTDSDTMFPTSHGSQVNHLATSSRPYEFLPLEDVTVEPQCNYRYLIIIDLEATCEHQGNNRNGGVEYKHEIIEFPLFLYDFEKQSIVSIFHAFCRPTKNPKLSAFCTQLTGITQKQVDDALTFPELLIKIEHWIYNECGLKNSDFAVTCDCNADMGKFMRIQCRLSGITMPDWCVQWCNIGRHFCDFYSVPKKRILPLAMMVDQLRLEFSGTQHRALHDCANILRIVETLLRDGLHLRKNEEFCNQPPSYCKNIPKNPPRTIVHNHSGAGDKVEKPEITDSDRDKLLLLLNMKKARLASE